MIKKNLCPTWRRQEELDDYYDEEYDLNSGLYDDDDNDNEYNEYDNYDNFDEEESGDYF